MPTQVEPDREEAKSKAKGKGSEEQAAYGYEAHVHYASPGVTPRATSYSPPSLYRLQARQCRTTPGQCDRPRRMRSKLQIIN